MRYESSQLSEMVVDHIASRLIRKAVLFAFSTTQPESYRLAPLRDEGPPRRMGSRVMDELLLRNLEARVGIEPEA
jgi:hypothetical protein